LFAQETSIGGSLGVSGKGADNGMDILESGTLTLKLRQRLHLSIGLDGKLCSNRCDSR